MAPDFTILALCSGGGGLERAVRLVVPAARVVCAVEREAFCIENLAWQVETAGVGPVALWPDLLTFDGRPWRGLIDCLTAGIPCQPHSVAGKRLGAADERNLWPAAERIIREVEPGFVFLENVAGAVAFFGTVVKPELEGMGYTVEPGLFTAAEVGAPQRRLRLFVLAHADGGRCPAAALQGLAQRPERNHADRPVRGTWPPGPGQVASIPRATDGDGPFIDGVRLLGGAVCELAAAYAFCTLLARLESRLTDD